MGTGIQLTEKGRKLLEEKILEAYYNPETREETIKIAKVLEIDLEALKDSVLKRSLDIKKPVRRKMILIEKCRECKHCNSITRMDGKNDCHITYEDERKDYRIIPDIDVIPDWCRLQDAPESE